MEPYKVDFIDWLIDVNSSFQSSWKTEFEYDIYYGYNVLISTHNELILFDSTWTLLS